MTAKTKPLTAHQVREKVGADSASKKGNEFTVRYGFFYTHGRTVDKYVTKVLLNYPEARITDQGEIWKPFRGGATVAQGSHWFVKFTLPEPNQGEPLDYDQPTGCGGLCPEGECSKRMQVRVANGDYY